MILPLVLKNFEVLIDGQSFGGRADEIQLPALEVVTEDHRGGAMDIPVKLDMGMQPLTMEVTLAEYSGDVWGAFGRKDGNQPQFVFRGYTEDENGNSGLVVVTCRGRVNRLSPESAKVGQKNTVSMMIDVSYYKAMIDGVIVHEIDPVNIVRTINGVNQLAAMKAALA